MRVLKAYTVTLINIGSDSNSTLKAESVEGQLLEICTFIKDAERTTTKNPENRNSITSFSCNFITKVANIGFTFPLSQGINSNGQPISTATNYLVNTGFVGATEGTLLSNSPEKVFLELLTYIQLLENDVTKNPDGNNNVTFSIEGDDSVVTGNMSLPILFGTNATTGEVVIGANEYLRD